MTPKYVSVKKGVKLCTMFLKQPTLKPQYVVIHHIPDEIFEGRIIRKGWWQFEVREYDQREANHTILLQTGLREGNAAYMKRVLKYLGPGAILIDV